MPKVVFFAIHSTTRWWKYLASRLDFADGVVLSDLRGEGDWVLVDDFYRFMRKGDAEAVAISRFGEDGCAEIILRCRSLRSLDRNLALQMIGGMVQAIERAFDSLDPGLIVTFTIDRYVTDVMERVARARNIDFLEMTTSILPDEVIFMRRGQLVRLREPSDDHVDSAVKALCQTDFAPTYVRDAKRFSRWKFWHVFGYFALRGAFFNLWRSRSPGSVKPTLCGLLKSLKHKVRPEDVVVLEMVAPDWESRLKAVTFDRRVFLGLQLFPEASMDYWLRSLDMLPHDDVIMEYCEVLGEAGYHTFVKDHPLQFGFRQRELLERLSKLPLVTLVPYDVPANLLIEQCGISVTFTGTIGFQAALAGRCSVVSEPYYATEQHYLHVRSFGEIRNVAEQLERWQPPENLNEARRDMVRHLAAASVEGNYYTWQNFDAVKPAIRASVEPLVRSLNQYLPRFLKSREISL
ncbi:hypothetical protein [Bradyrhizobium sp. RDI18]|uniref:hypothetical protein n=1 Tax=Bradyrhizobium sp. RDI18 TaxID=3367400 RepID=UPI003718FF5C